MCTLVLAHRLYPSHPLVVAANRDELLARPASGPRLYDGSPRVLMPRDEVAGGTWLGLNEHGLFVGITNRAGQAPDPARRSRGQLVLQALRARDATGLHRALSDLRAAEYNSFHLLYADRSAAFVTWSDGERLAQHALEPGLHVVTERSLDADDRGRTERLRRHFARELAGGAPTVGGLHALLTLHGPAAEPLAGSCVHADALGYGTRSSFVLIDGERPAGAWVEGHPCRHPLVPLDAALEELLQNGRDPAPRA